MTSAAVLDLTKLAEDLGRAGQNAEKEVDRLLSQTAEQIYHAMVTMAPRRTGRLARSIAVQAAPGRYVIGPNGVPYASFVEFGTGSRGEFPTGPYEIRPKNAYALAFKVGNRTVFATSVVHPGIRPNPYVRPAAQAYLDSLGGKAADVGVKMIVGEQ